MYKKGRSVAKIIFPEIELSNVKNIFIDIDDTLYLYEPCHEYAINQCLQKAKQDKHLSHIDSKLFKEKYRTYRNIVTNRLHPQGACRSRVVAFAEMFDELNIKNSYINALKYAKLYWHELISQVTLEQDAKNFLQKALKKNIPVTAVTDMTTEEQIKKLSKMKAVKYVKRIVSSEMAGVEKPNPEIFQLAMKLSEAEAKTTIMIGDNPKKDGIGASNMGIKFYQVNIYD